MLALSIAAVSFFLDGGIERASQGIPSCERSVGITPCVTVRVLRISMAVHC